MILGNIDLNSIHHMGNQQHCHHLSGVTVAQKVEGFVLKSEGWQFESRSVLCACSVCVVGGG